MTQEEERIAVLAQRLEDYIESDKESRAETRAQIAEVSRKVDLLAEAFQQGRGMIKLISWLAAGAATLAALAALVKDILMSIR